jgi:hypothetical protein
MMPSLSTRYRFAMLSRQVPCGALAALLSVGVLAWWLRRGLSIFDVRLWDETIYLDCGLSADRPFANYEMSGLYCQIYAFVHLFVSDPLDVYLFGGFLVTGLCAVAIAVVLAELSRSATFALVILGLLIASNALLIWPRVSLAAIVVMSVGIVGAARMTNRFSAYAVLMVTAFLVTFMRPEYVLAFYLLALVTVVYGIKTSMEGTLFARRFLPGWLAVGATIVLISAWSLPVVHGGDRAFMAFGQHFSLRHVEQNGLTIDPWLGWERITQEAFPGARTVLQAATISPGRFTQFVVANMFDAVLTLLNLGRTLLVRAYLHGPAGMIAGLVLMAGALRLGMRRSHSVAPTFCPSVLLIGLTLLALPMLVSVTLVYPRQHYMIVLIVLAMCAVGLKLGRFFCDRSIAPALVATAGCLMFLPAAQQIQQPWKAAIQGVRNVPGIVTLFEADGGWCTYYVPRCATVFAYDWKGDQPLGSFLRKERVNAIAVTPRLLDYARVFQDPYLRALRENPSLFGYIAFQVNPNVTILVKERPKS